MTIKEINDKADSTYDDYARRIAFKKGALWHRANEHNIPTGEQIKEIAKYVASFFGRNLCGKELDDISEVMKKKFKK